MDTLKEQIAFFEMRSTTQTDGITVKQSNQQGAIEVHALAREFGDEEEACAVVTIPYYAARDLCNTILHWLDIKDGRYDGQNGQHA